jgi:adenylate cyclase
MRNLHLLSALARRIRQVWVRDWPTIFLVQIVVVTLVGVQSWGSHFGDALRLQVFDQYLRWLPRETPEVSPIVIIDVDEESLTQFGQWPWSRMLLARLIDQLSRAGVAVIGFDVIFAEPDRLSPPNIAKELAEIYPDAATTLRELPDNDWFMGEVMQRSRVVLGLGGSARKLDAGRPPIPSLVSVAELGGDPRPIVTSYADSVRSLPVLESAASGLGLITIVPEHDGVVRRVPLVASVDGKLLPTLALEMLRVATGQSTFVVSSGSAGIEDVILQGTRIPTDRRGRAFVHFSGRRPDLYVSAAAVLNDEVDAERLRGRLALIGVSAAGLGDIKLTPVIGNVPGVEVHAQLLETIISNDYVNRPAGAIGGERMLLLGVGTLLAVAGPSISAILLGPILLIAVALPLGVSWLAFSRYGLFVDGVYPALGVVIVIVLLVLVRFVRDQARRRQVRNAFSRYLAPEMVEQLSRNPNLARLSGERREMTLLFCDIRDFTEMSEQFISEPERLTKLVNAYLTEMTAAVLAHGGTIDKYIGDALMAIWNAPLPTHRHALSACLAALEMRRRLHNFNVRIGRDYAARGLPFKPIEMGIGINTGTCFVGNLGSEQRFSYSVLGDAVNVAARLEGQTKTYGVSTMIGETTQSAASELATLALQPIVLKGKTKPLIPYALVGNADEAKSEEFCRLSAAHHELTFAMRRKQLDQIAHWLRCCHTDGKAYGMTACYRYYEQQLADMRRATRLGSATAGPPSR